MLKMLFLVAWLFPRWVVATEPETQVYAKEVKVTEILKTLQTADAQAIKYPRVAHPEVTILNIEIPPGKESGWHKHPVPIYAYVVSGQLTVEIAGGKEFNYTAGQGFAEVVNVFHNGKNLGTEPVKLIAVITGEQGKAFTVKRSP